MSASIIVLSNQNGWEERRGTCSSQPSASGVTALSRHAGCISTIFGHVSFTSVRGTVADGKRTRHRTSFSYQSTAPSPLRSVIAAASSLGGVAACGLSRSISVRRRPFNSVWPFKAARRLFLVGIHSAFAVRQNLPRWAANLMHFDVLSLVAVEQPDSSERTIPYDGNLTARDGNSTARGGNVPS